MLAPASFSRWVTPLRWRDDPRQPAAFPCAWAWDDIHKIVLALLHGGDFGQWMQNPHEFVACCTDGVKPVVFQIERVEG